MKTKETSICSECGKPKNGVETGLCNHCGKFGKTRKQKALTWWNSLPRWGIPSKEYYTGLYYSDDNITHERIEKIYVREVLVNQHNAKLNQKQFKQFDESLFKAYINKFSDEDKLKAFKYLATETLFYKHFNEFIIERENKTKNNNHKSIYIIIREFVNKKIK